MPKYSGGASAFIVHKNKILLFHRDNIPTISAPDCWGLPGGKIEIGETSLQGLKRELKEEVAHVPKTIKYIGKKTFYTDKLAYFYMSYVNNKEASFFKHIGDEGQEIDFFTLNEIAKLKLTEVTRYYYVKYKNIFAQHIKNKTYPKAAEIGLD